jgi:N-acetylglucosamine malate deacetylase 1
VVERCDVLAVGAHPDDVELGCGGTLARLAASGRRVGILDLTAGELATRGDAAVRAREAEAAAHALGVAWRICLELPDGGLNGDDPSQGAAVVGTLRAAQPRALLLPHREDPHPDHGAALALLMRASFFAGLSRWESRLGGPHRPRLLLAYPGPRQVLQAAVVVDVGAWYGAKREALAAHASQFQPAAGVATHLSSGYFLAAVEGRDRACGNIVGYEIGEGFGALGALPADELAWLLGGSR